MWEVQGHGTVTGAGDPRDGAARREILPPWVDIRLTFADGARIDVLAVVRDGRIAIEDAQADPPLALDGFAALAEAIEAPLHNACQVVAGRHRPPAPQPAGGGAPVDAPVAHPAPGSDEGPRPLPEGPVSPEETRLQAESVPTHVSGPVPLAAEGPSERPAEWPVEESAPERAPDPAPAAPPEPEPVDAPSAAQGTAQAAAPEAAQTAAQEQDRSGRHRARPSLPRGSAARQGVAEIYRAAQQAGQDPVLAVMSATGFSRRKALRMIAGARDEGHLTPRHHRR
ncbi:DUF6214 family protein [Streptomyces sp. 35G-GA-8]|uniref:DUF6214 family protein n=1 Tax=Streptomyces sp. 35G-GA-8 TaxID=2939434 RepID=UPI00201EE1CF|nr:DUF6214 family protein [Streptomyces sp. 35G-GA-8]MCL7376837.1 DUF6214 family protein [Streptomyces sp. 35G-GA-8]